MAASDRVADPAPSPGPDAGPDATPAPAPAPTARATPGRAARRPCSARKLAANRANAQKSTGPRTAKGKARSRWNGLVHGLCASLALLPGEDEVAFNRFIVGVYADLRPRGPTEAVLVDQYVSVAWKLRRLGAVEGRMAGFHLANDAGEYVHDRDAYAFAMKYPQFKEQAERYGPPEPPGQQPAAEWLLEELLRGRGMMLRLMDLEIRLRATLQSTIRQLKDLRALRRQQEQEEAERAGDEEPWRGPWEEEPPEEEGDPGGEEVEPDGEAGGEPGGDVGDDVAVASDAPPVRTGPTAGRREPVADAAPQPPAAATDAAPAVDAEGAAGGSAMAGSGAWGEPTKPTEPAAPPGSDAGPPGGPSAPWPPAEGQHPPG